MRSPSTALALALLAATSCTDLPAIDASGCGNRLVNSDREDCDGEAPAGARCGAPGQASACRYVCDPQGRPGEPVCPSGFGCGLDGLCRSWSRQFVPLGDPIATGDVRLLSADLDGDRRPELLTMGVPDLLGGRSVRLISPLADGSLREVVAFPSLLGAPRFGDLNGDGIDDLLLGYNTGVAVLTNQRGQGLSPLVYPTFSLPDPTGQQRLRAFPTRFRAEAPRARVAVLLRDPDETGAGPPSNVLIADVRTGPVDPSCDPNQPRAQTGTVLALLEANEGPEDLVYSAVGGFNADEPTSDGDLVLLGFAKRQDVLVYSPVLPGSSDQWNQVLPPVDGYRAPLRVRLAKGAHPQGAAHWARFDPDPWFDLILGTDQGPQLAFGSAGGAFASTPGGEATNQAVAVDQLRCQAGEPCARLLAVGDLNADGEVDFVFDRGIFETRVVGPGLVDYQQTYGKLGGLWSEAHVADLDGDQRLDVAAVSARVPNVDVLLNRGGGIYNPSLLATSAATSQLCSSDVDGDGIADLMLREQGYHLEDNPPPTAALGDALLVSFGQRGSAPLAPSLVGRFNNLRQISAAPLTENALDSPDAYGEVGVVYEPEGGGSSSVAILFGNASRQLFSPYGLAESFCRIRAQSLGHAAGRFTPDDEPDLVTLAGSLLEPQGPGEQEQNVRLWTIPGQGQGQLGSPALSGRLGAGLRFVQAERGLTQEQASVEDPVELLGIHNEALLAVGDVDRAADGLDELVLVVPFSDDGPPRGGALVVARSTELAGGQRAVVPAGEPMRFERSVIRSERPALVDLDGDGYLDLLLLAAGPFGDASLLVFWNNQAGGFSQPQAIEGLGSPRSFALLPALGAGPPSVMVVGEGQASLLTHDGQRAFRAEAMPSSLGGTSVTSGDFNGDGLADLAVLQAGQAQIFSGQPRLR